MDRLLELEQEHNLWDVQVNGVCLWALVRWTLLTYLLGKERDYESLASPGRKVRLSPRRWGTYWRTLRWLMFDKSKQWDTLFIVTNANRYPLPGSNRSFDRLYGEYYDRIEGTLVLESAFGSKWPPPDARHGENIFSQECIWLYALMKARSVALTDGAQRQIEEFSRQVTDIYGVPEKQASVLRTAQNLVRKAEATRIFVELFLAPRLRNPVVFIEEASYMGRYALLTTAFHRLGFRVIEPQHGFIDDWHYAYTYPPACITEPDHPCRTLLPDVLLTFGEHWSNVAQTPSEKVVIGYPYLTQMVEQTTSSIQQNDKQILVLSGHIVADRTIALVGQLSQALPDHTVVVKLHPLEVADRPRYQTRLDRPNIRVIGQADVFPLVAGSAVIVSLYATTVMVEAAAFPGKRIFCQEAHLLPAGISVPFDDGAHLVKLINTPDASMLKVDPGQFWTVGWKHNLETFLKSQNLYL